LLSSTFGESNNVAFLFSFAFSVKSLELSLVSLLEVTNNLSVLLATSSHFLALCIHFLQVGLLSLSCLVVKADDLLLKVRNFSNKSIRVHLVLFGVLLDLIGNFLNGGLEVLTGTLTLAKHVLVLLKIALEVDIYSKLLIETDEKVFEVLLLSAAALELHMEVGIVSLLHHVGREAVDLDLAGGGLAARA
jgi:hypothetical protein